MHMGEVDTDAGISALCPVVWAARELDMSGEGGGYERARLLLVERRGRGRRTLWMSGGESG